MNENLLYRLYTGTGTTLDAAMKEATDSYNIGYVHNTTDGYFAADIQSETLYVSGIYHFVIKVVYKRANKVANDITMLRAMNNTAPYNKPTSTDIVLKHLDNSDIKFVEHHTLEQALTEENLSMTRNTIILHGVARAYAWLIRGYNMGYSDARKVIKTALEDIEQHDTVLLAADKKNIRAE